MRGRTMRARPGREEAWMSTTVLRGAAARSRAARLLPSEGVRTWVALIAPGVVGLALAVTMPRGPVTTAGALLAMVIGATVGLAYGAAARSRWALLAAPLT